MHIRAEREPEAWRRWVAARLLDVGAGRGTVALHPAGHADGEATVWRVTLDGETQAYLKVHRVPDKWRRERAILERLAALPSPRSGPPSGPPSSGLVVPRVLASTDDGWALLLHAVPGVRVSDAALDGATHRALHELAGRFRRRLDELEVELEDPVPVVAAIERRQRAWLERARIDLDAALCERAAAAFDARCFEGASRRWCHRDFTPHNWVIDRSGSGLVLGVIDFGQARPDVWLTDVVKLHEGAWRRDPGLERAFWAGYGRPPSGEERARLDQLVLLHGLATAAWGDRHGHEGFSQEGRAVLRRVLGDD